jgi:hypothetical protein
MPGPNNIIPVVIVPDVIVPTVSVVPNIVELGITICLGIDVFAGIFVPEILAPNIASVAVLVDIILLLFVVDPTTVIDGL